MSISFVVPSTAETLVISSFFALLHVARIISHKILKVETIGFIAVGVIYGAPITNLLRLEWQETFTAIGYLGLILLVFEGALCTNIRLVVRNLGLSTVCAMTGVVFPIGLSMLLLVPAFKYTMIQAFAAGAALAATSLGTTVAVLKAGSTPPQSTWFSASITTILMSAATIDDVIGLVMASVMPTLGKSDSSTIGWTVGRPILASVGLAIVTLACAKIIRVAQPLNVWMGFLPERSRLRFMFLCIVICLTALTAAAAYAGTSIIFGSFAAGMVFSYVDTLDEEASHHDSDEVRQRPRGPNFQTVFQQKFGPVQEYLFAPLFFASIGFAIPFRDLWQGINVWRGITYAVLMMLGKLVVGMWIPIWSIFRPRRTAADEPVIREGDMTLREPEPAGSLKVSGPAGILLGSGMVARGEIGLLIVQLGYESGYGPIPYDLYIICIWALVINTIVGPILVTATLSQWRNTILKGPWGVPPSPSEERSSHIHELPNVSLT
ncbi:hypothetical protein M408DRAFT_310029 [Serendipita vermifera MAFF 305830]|uniref:Cation/H+ exchanger transmembrane domain-containing protein n=1 Tax=Serendipita vermifera MAFF 305830 TaxID=933852 RepID=A0A0C3BQ40_SERVB|nr:hypothetical protein M408DRAFT_310029 [Serendipita vermifera MAFF 305830]